MVIDNPIIWFTHNKTLLNLRLWDRHLQVWMWGCRIIPSETGRNCFKLHRLCFIAFVPKRDE